MSRASGEVTSPRPSLVTSYSPPVSASSLIGAEVQILGTDLCGHDFWFWGRFEIGGQNNPVFYTTFGRVIPDLQETRFRFDS